MKHKKAQEFNYILFLALFITFFSIVGLILNVTVLEEESKVKSDIFDFIDNIPIISPFVNFIFNSLSMVYIHPYLATIYLALFGVPVAYIIIRLIKGGG